MSQDVGCSRFCICLRPCALQQGYGFLRCSGNASHNHNFLFNVDVGAPSHALASRYVLLLSGSADSLIPHLKLERAQAARADIVLLAK